MLTKPFLLTSIATTVLALSLVAQAQSPFAKRGQQAWEAPQPAQQTATPQPARPSVSPPISDDNALAGGSVPLRGTYQTPSAQILPAQPSVQSSRSMAGVSSISGVSGSSQNSITYKPANSTAVRTVPSQNMPMQPLSQSTAAAGQGTGSALPAGTYVPPTYNAAPVQNYPVQNYNYNAAPRYTGQDTMPVLAGGPPAPSGGYYAGDYSAATHAPAYNAPAYTGGTATPMPQAQPSWRTRMGLDNIATSLSGFFKGGAAATNRDIAGDDDWDADFIADAAVRGEISAITQTGLEYGLGGALRGQYDKYRRGFGGRVGDCDPALAGCSSAVFEGATVALRGHTSRFYSFGEADDKEAEFQLEGAYLFLRSAYGDVTLGRDDGAAYLFSLGAPSLLAMGASNSPVDYTGLDAVKTINDASGFAEKITYTSPRLLGDTVGVGVQFGASYAPDARACGVDYCVRKPSKEPLGIIAPDLDNVAEFGLALDRTFDNGLSIEGTVTYAMADQKHDSDALDDLKALGLGLELGYQNWVIGGSYLDSNNGLDAGDYTAWDVGVTWQPNQFGFTAGYGHAKDKNVDLTSDQVIFGVSYDIDDRYRLSSGVQYIDRDVGVNLGAGRGDRSEKATAVFLEGRVTF